ncbi:ExbD/TolR family protein [Luteolibacter luteus]|uniref:Biopolymer transporter ExbD n=1 Tax=Luteolibacter luteus TaxID=2728835 RepID=A0A858RJW2_9BACT|nr:biopolymer transporter ExbD [Luteolibacter luteus]QJE97566.1 biopolymer transporter ExbD [Luteolibacter luteus]
MPIKLQSSGGDDHEEDARIEIVPLIDIMFFLLASFMMVSLSMTQINRVNIKLPVAAASEQTQKAPPIHLAIDSHGVITWDAKIVTPTEITDRLISLPVTPDTKVLIAADTSCNMGQAMAVLDAVKAAKVDKAAFETKAPAQ